MILKPFFTLPALLGVVNAITVYGVGGASLQSISTTASASASMSAVPAGYTPPALKTVMLTPPPVPSPIPSMSFTVELQNSADNVPGLSIPQSGAFYGFSIEMSIVNQVSAYISCSFWCYTILNCISSCLPPQSWRQFVRSQILWFKVPNFLTHYFPGHILKFLFLI